MRKPELSKAGRSAKPAVYAVTAARPSLSDDVKKRHRTYAYTMGLRTGCFILCVVTSGALQWAFFVGALVLPYFAVVVANAGRESGGPAVAPVVLPSRHDLVRVRQEDFSRES